MSKVVVLGNGGRESSVIEKFSKSPSVEKIYSNCDNLNFSGKLLPLSPKSNEIEEISKRIIKLGCDMVFVGPEAPLVEGIVDELNKRGFNRVLGPTKEFAKLEGSKIHSYNLAKKYGIPQAEAIIMSSKDDPKKTIGENKDFFENGVVVKKDGLCGGKGVKVYLNIEDALKDASKFLKDNSPNQDYLLAKRLVGYERSLFGIGHNNFFSTVPGAFLDHKPLNNFNEGPNTGGMGAYGPVNLGKYSLEDLSNKFLKPIFETGYSGILYAGLMITKEGPKLIEYNVRGGDPEWQLVTSLMENDIYNFHDALFKKENPEIKFKNDNKAINVVLASNGYPGKIETGIPIKGLEKAIREFDVNIFHGGTKYNESGDILTNGGRVLHICAVGENEENIIKKVYGAIDIIVKNTKPGTFVYRKDIPYYGGEK